VKLAHHFTGQFGNPMDAAQESGTWGDEGKAVERRGALTALLFEQRASAMNFDLDQRARVRSFVLDYALRRSRKKAQLVLQSGTNLGHQKFGGLFLSSSRASAVSEAP
jgi:hypothetical protein